MPTFNVFESSTGIRIALTDPEVVSAARHHSSAYGPVTYADNNNNPQISARYASSPWRHVASLVAESCPEAIASTHGEKASEWFSVADLAEEILSEQADALLARTQPGFWADYLIMMEVSPA